MSVTIINRKKPAYDHMPNISGWEFNGHIHALAGVPFYFEMPMIDVETGKVFREVPRPPDDGTKKQTERWARILRRRYLEGAYDQEHRLKLLKERSEGLIAKDMDLSGYIDQYCQWLETCGGYSLAT